MSISEIVLNELARITGNDAVRQNLDIKLFEEDILDSLGTMELIVALGECCHIDVSPAQLEREMWATPRKIIEDIESRVNR